ncbi:TPA: hypothetical protein TUU08_000905 [Streptococcus equi subsp. zooepidemicus]|uniref:Uncharacterized protein n=2 Tax=Streptococcus equi TaxID=1336 RepID=C0MFN8_STRS7|nr:hypothetical protein [Streptococcus equi]MCD3387976.1 hypothetical protein [Streptococcus equi subsp. zooepidemicus]MCD3399681.1 hypothetical protein [Streptococcus equi subsp. zooepidemicus]MCD3451957.1 hypothetical protein [Streptococcus equi subsp. zooepidemicus]MCD3465199.1 hypothetical protein [Streptococcus equi subsp. zooepidemicus]CAW97975.1 hypothetical protein SZO_02300 [Streptococcus equi subsp. zooepidemicus]
MNNLLEQYLFDIPGAFYYTTEGEQCNQSVHGNSYSRFNEAKKQLSKSIVEVDKIATDILEFLEKLGIRTTKSPKIEPSSIDYESIKEGYNLNDKADLVWLKFVKSGHVGVVATSNDVNFQIPKNESEYDLKESMNNDWKYNSAGIIIHKLGLEWDESFVLLFPLGNIPTGYKRHDIEKAIGNFLYKKGVPILDLYSHLY